MAEELEPDSASANPPELPELPKLAHELPAPEDYLPGTPWWIWGLIGLGVILLLALLIWIIKRTLKDAAPPLQPQKNHYAIASASLTRLETDCGDKPLAQVASNASFAIRGYLAGVKNEPALYETTEEFKARNPSLPLAVTSLLDDLNDAKYAKSTIDESRARDFLTRSQSLLHTLHSAAELPEPAVN